MSSELNRFVEHLGLLRVVARDGAELHEQAGSNVGLGRPGQALRVRVLGLPALAYSDFDPAGFGGRSVLNFLPSRGRAG